MAVGEIEGLYLERQHRSSRKVEICISCNPSFASSAPTLVGASSPRKQLPGSLRLKLRHAAAAAASVALSTHFLAWQGADKNEQSAAFARLSIASLRVFIDRISIKIEFFTKNKRINIQILCSVGCCHCFRRQSDISVEGHGCPPNCETVEYFVVRGGGMLSSHPLQRGGDGKILERNRKGGGMNIDDELEPTRYATSSSCVSHVVPSLAYIQARCTRIINTFELRRRRSVFFR